MVNNFTISSSWFLFSSAKWWGRISGEIRHEPLTGAEWAEVGCRDRQRLLLANRTNNNATAQSARCFYANDQNGENCALIFAHTLESEEHARRTSTNRFWNCTRAHKTAHIQPHTFKQYYYYMYREESMVGLSHHTSCIVCAMCVPRWIAYHYLILLFTLHFVFSYVARPLELCPLLVINVCTHTYFIDTRYHIIRKHYWPRWVDTA